MTPIKSGTAKRLGLTRRDPFEPPPFTAEQRRHARSMAAGAALFADLMLGIAAEADPARPQEAT